MPSAARRLSPLDALFLYIESDEAPMHIGACCVYDGDIPFERYRDALARRLDRVPQCRQRLAFAPWNLAHPALLEAPDFDIRRHVTELRPRHPLSMPQLRCVVERIYRKRLPLDRPLWRQHVIRGLPGRKTAIFWELHHCIADGLSSVRIIEALHDAGQPIPGEPGVGGGEPGVADALADSLRAGAGLLRDLPRLAAASITGLLEGHGRETSMAAARTLHASFAPAPRLPFNTSALSGAKRAAWCAFPLEGLRAAAHARGAKVNDAILAIVGGALARHFDGGIRAGGAAKLRVAVPVNLRAPGAADALGNQVAIQPVTLALRPMSPDSRLDAVRAQTRDLKAGHIADGVNVLVRLLEAVPPPVQSGVGAWAQHSGVVSSLRRVTTFPTMNAICTNVVGPREPLRMLGRNCVAMHPMAPITTGMGLVFACVSHAETLYLSAVADRAAMPDMARLGRCLERSHNELVRA